MRILMSATLALGLVACANANSLSDEDLQTARELRDAAMQGTGAFEIVEDLTTRVGPRMPGSDGDARGVAWAQEKLEGMGFDEVRLEPVTFPTWQRGKEEARIVGNFAQPLIVTTLGYAPPTPEGGLEADVVMFDDLAALQAASADEFGRAHPYAFGFAATLWG